MTSTRRTARLNEQIKREISRILRMDVRDPRVGLPTVTDVEVTPDLWLARVYVRPDPTQSGEAVEELLEGLSTAAPFIRKELGRGLKVRRTPELRFYADRTLEDAMRVEKILREALGETGEGEPDPDASSESK